MCLPPFRRAQRGNTVLQGYFGCFVLSEPGTLVWFGVIQIRKIWMRKCLPIRLFAFGDERHEGSVKIFELIACPVFVLPDFLSVVRFVWPRFFVSSPVTV